jgi:hypothetical protein
MIDRIGIHSLHCDAPGTSVDYCLNSSITQEELAIKIIKVCGENSENRKS